MKNIMSGRNKLCISFSGGRTSAFMTKWCLENLKGEYDMVVVFANTGDEREETLEFVHKCDMHFGFDVVWIECVTNKTYRKGVSAKIVDFETASRNGDPFDSMIAKHGIPNQSHPHCSRELKERAIRAYLRDQLGWKKREYKTAIGIRSDEPDRLDWKKAKKESLIYPLATMIRVNRFNINDFWSRMPFDLNLKSYEGNCKTCWKKSIRKLMTIAIENPQCFDFTRRMEIKYGNYIPDSRQHHETELPIRFFRDRMSVEDIFEESKFPFQRSRDESKDKNEQREMFSDWDEYLDGNFGCTESCEAF